MTDEIVLEVRKNRAAYAAKHGNDLDRIYHDLVRRQARSGRHLLDLAGKRRQQHRAVRESR